MLLSLAPRPPLKMSSNYHLKRDNFSIGNQTVSQDITQDTRISDRIKDGIVTGYLPRRKGPGSWR